MTPVVVPLAGGGAQVIGIFVARPNRFLVEAQLSDGALVRAHMADRGRLVETLIPGVPVCLVSRPGENRATQWQAAAAQRADGSWASLDTLLPNRLMRSVLEQHLIPQLPTYHTVRREVTLGTSRFDFVLDGATTTVLEVKSAGRIVASSGLVPDAPSSRAARHVSELILLAQSGYHA
ncbi:MAG: DNA/RNA nuclease SfsA, partial [Roseiflexaceae bacterium]